MVDVTPRSTDLHRFSPVERAVHWITAVLTFVLIASGTVLWVPSLGALIGRREVMKWVHVGAGLGLPLAPLCGLVDRAYRHDLHILNRFRDREWRWFVGRWPKERVGKFNPGQKINAAFMGGMIVVMLLTGLGLLNPQYFPDEWRTGLTVVHDLTYGLVIVAIIGHVVLATREKATLRGMITGRVPRRWARRHHPAWAAEHEPAPGASPTVSPWAP